MSNKKNHNSILVLATLGVYLGLVLVGATPQVLAQAAMTKQFNVKDEVEVKDDLDKKPEPASLQSDTSPDLAEAGLVTASIEKFLSNFRTGKTGDAIFQDTAQFFNYREARMAPQNSHFSAHAFAVPIFGPILSPNALPRAGLDRLLAANAK